MPHPARKLPPARTSVILNSFIGASPVKFGLIREARCIAAQLRCLREARNKSLGALAFTGEGEEGAASATTSETAAAAKTSLHPAGRITQLRCALIAALPSRTLLIQGGATLGGSQAPVRIASRGPLGGASHP